MDYATLTAELRDDPLSRGYAAMSDEAAADSLNASDRPKRELVPRWRVKDIIYRAGCWPLLLAAQQHEDQITAGTAVTALAYLSDPDFENLNLDLPGVSDMFDRLVSASILPAPLAASILAMADTTQSRAAELGLDGVTNGHVKSAREMIANGL